MHDSWRAFRATILLTVAAAACADRLPTDPGALGASGPAFNEMAATAAWNGKIRIGVVPSADAVLVGANGPYTIRAKTSGEALYTGNSAPVTVRLGSTTAATHYRLQVMCASTSAVAARKAQAEAAGHPTYTEFVASANCTRLYIGQFPSNASFSVRNAYRNQLIAAGLAGSDSFWRLVTQPGVTRYEIVSNGVQVAASLEPVVVSPDDAGGLVTIAGARYRGVAEVLLNGGGKLAGVNELPIEEYLYGVVPRELPPVPYGELEAQKAQAVAARTYAVSGLGKRASEGYDLLPTTSDQVYGGYAAEHPVSSQAVDATAGVVATYEGKLIQALFSSTSGGYTSNNEEVYASDPVPYLRAKPDAQRGQSLEHAPDHAVFKYDRNASSLRGFKGGDYEADWSRYHRWTFEWTAEEISRVIGAYAGRPVGRVLAINVLERGPSGRVLRIEYVTEAGTFHDTKDRIRSSLKFINATGGMSSLLSTLFYIEPVVRKQTGEVTGFVAYGGGWGHGVGLAQTGAVGMAEKGATYEEILKFYYTGIDIEKRW